MSKNIDQVFVANPITSNVSTDLMYFGQSPYGAGNDAAMTFANFSAQFGLSGGVITLSHGGTNANLTANNGGIFYSTASAGAILSGTATAQQLLLSGASTTPQWSTTTYPLTNAINTLLYASAANVMSALATGNNGTLITSSGGVPSISSTLPTAVQANITQLGAQSQALNMNSNQINNVSAPTNANDAVNKQYADNIASGLNPVEGVYAGSTANLTSYTYNNGVSGVGATLTAPGNGVFTVDGVSPPVGSRFLYKDDSTGLGAYNGIYTITTSTAGSPAVLTRATDYNQPNQIQAGDLIAIEFGTVNASSTWLQTATIVSVGVTPLAFSAFFLPSNFVSSSLTSGHFFIGNGSNIAVASTSTIPTSAGATANKHLISDGTNYVLSTPTFPNTSPAAGLFIVSDGTNFVSSAKAAFTTINVQTFTGGGTYTPTTGMKYCIIECVGGGGAGGGVAVTSTTQLNGGGGGAGSYSRKFATAATVGASQTVTIGAAGSPGSAGANPGGNGGDTSVGSICIGKGGTGGGGATATASVNGGAGGIAGTGDFTPVGNSGTYGAAGDATVATHCLLPRGIGGAGPFGGQNGASATTGGAGNNYGAGGNGALTQAGNAALAGAAGAAGVVIITEFIYA